MVDTNTKVTAVVRECEGPSYVLQIADPFALGHRLLAMTANAETPVQMIERFYGKLPSYSPKQAASLNRGMQKGS